MDVMLESWKNGALTSMSSGSSVSLGTQPVRGGYGRRATDLVSWNRVGGLLIRQRRLRSQSRGGGQG